MISIDKNISRHRSAHSNYLILSFVAGHAPSCPSVSRVSELGSIGRNRNNVSSLISYFFGDIMDVLKNFV